MFCTSNDGLVEIFSMALLPSYVIRFLAFLIKSFVLSLFKVELEEKNKFISDLESDIANRYMF